ncbi:hypothetical protein Q762_14480 [Flavobacterium cauense R2A-7]|uniref:Uncharacterized protein n=1 Tax=Flavobacterium suncheonense GH29-5 = DSM 17707 TaxID=1121899 RepID=A0A0A2M146_9FLAO|nr:hypothetical protein Q762_14480 [Flavobacterium cauense R2A-7]KGO85148.1 hypothetical protein Q764_14225 [Flavobacterium suncheonense GH29-5 = DSM 17707]
MTKLFDNLFQKRMFLLVLLIYIFFIFFIMPKDYGINKTVGWAWDFYEFYSPLIFISLFYLFFIFYSIIALCKWKTNKTISIVHFITILISIYFFEFYSFGFLQLCNFLSILLFLINIIWSFINRQSNIKTSA